MICVFPVAVVPFSSVFATVTSAASSTLTGTGASILSAVSVTAAESPSSVSSAEAAAFTTASDGPVSVPETIATLCIFICSDLLALVTDL